MSISFLRQLLMKEAVKKSAGSSGIMSINKNITKEVEQLLQKYINDAMQQGVDIETLSPDQLKMIVAMNKPQPPKIYSGQAAVDQLNKFFPKKGEVIPFKQKRSFAEEIDAMRKSGDIVDVDDINISEKITDREMFKNSNLNKPKSDAEIKAKYDKLNKDSVERLKKKKRDSMPIRLMKNFEKELNEADLIAEGYSKDQANVLIKARKKMTSGEEMNPNESLLRVKEEFADKAGVDVEDFTDIDFEIDVPDFAKGGRAGFYTGGITDVEPSLDDIGHGSDSLMSRTRLMSPGSQTTTSTGLNYLLAEDNDNLRVPFAGGGDAGRRAFLKLMASIGGLTAAAKSGILGLGEGTGKKAVTETVKQAAGSGRPPPYFFKLVDKIKFMGDDVTEKAATQEREIVKRYKDYEMTEDIGTGNIVIKKRNEGSFYDQDGIISDEYIVYKPGQADELTKGKKPPPEYDEYTVRPDGDGKLRDSEDGLDSIDEILEEVGDPDSMTLKKADGGRIGYNIGGLSKLGINSTSRRFLEKVFGKGSLDEMLKRDPGMHRGLLEVVEMFRNRDKEGLKMYMQKFLPHMDDETVEAFIKGDAADAAGQGKYGLDNIQGQLIRLGSGRDYAGKIEAMKKLDNAKKLDTLDVTEEMIRKPNASGGLTTMLGGIMDIEEILYTFEDDYNPSSMVPGPRNMYSQGQLVRNTVDGSRPGYSGERDFGKTVEPNIRLRSGKYDVSYKGESLGSFNKITDARNAIKKAKEDNPPKKTGIVKEGSRGDILRKKLNTFIKLNNTSPSFQEVTEDITFKDSRDKAKYKKVLNSIMQNDEKYSIFKIDTADRLTELEQKIVTDNFELPSGQKEWDFKKQKFGININENPNLAERIKRKIDGPQKYTIAADSAKPSGWMMNAMNRLYKNEIKKGVKPKDLTYKPIKKNGIIIGFTDTTASGGNKTYYGLKKNTPEDATPWTAHGDHERIKKFLKIAKGAQIDDPSKLLQKILDDKGITKLMGDKSVLTLNDILSHERYYKNISDIAPMKLLERQIVLHHGGGVGAGTNIARAAATKDIQLLTGAVNDNVKNLERIVRGTNKTPARKLNADEISQLKNYGAKITDFDGKVVGGGFTDPTKQFAGIEKKALEYAKGDQFNVKTVASYLERLGCGKAAGGRILFAEGVPSLTKCAKEGVKKLEKGLRNGFKNADDAVLARGILKSGKFLKDAVSFRGLFGPAALAFTALAEAGFVGYDMLVSGKSFREAVGDSVFNYALGDKTKIDSDEEFIKRLKSTGNMNDQQIGKMLNFKSVIDDMNRGFDLNTKLEDLEGVQEVRDEKGNIIVKGKTGEISDNRTNAALGFGDNAFNLSVAERDALRADIRDYNKTGTPRRVTDYLLSDKGAEGAKASNRANLLVKQDQLENAIGTGGVLPKIDQGIEKNLIDTQYQLYKMNNPTEYNDFAKYFMSRPKQEQSMIMGLGYKEGGIASLNVNKK